MNQKIKRLKFDIFINLKIDRLCISINTYPARLSLNYYPGFHQKLHN
jgi:hypothetical protein